MTIIQTPTALEAFQGRKVRTYAQQGIQFREVEASPGSRYLEGRAAPYDTWEDVITAPTGAVADHRKNPNRKTPPPQADLGPREAPPPPREHRAPRRSVRCVAVLAACLLHESRSLSP